MKRVWHNIFGWFFGHGYNAVWVLGTGTICIDCGKHLSDNG